MPKRKKLPSCSVLKRMYIDKEMSQIDIGEIYDVTRAGVSYALDKCQIRARTNSEARVLALKKNKFEIFQKRFNKQFFSEISERMAWALGVFFACGTIVESTIGLTVSNERMWVMKRLSEMLEFGEFEWNGVDWDAGKTIMLSSVEMSRGLRRLGFPIGKRQEFSMPVIPAGMMGYFILGYYQRRAFISYSKQFLKEIRWWLTEYGVSEVAQVTGDNGEYRIVAGDGIVKLMNEINFDFSVMGGWN